MNKQSMRDFLAMVERDFPDEIVRVREPVRRELDITSTVFELERAGRSPVVIFEHVQGFEMPVVTNLAGNRRLIAASMQVEPSALATAFRERCQNYRPVERVDCAPWQEVVIEGGALDLTKLPIPVHFAVDAAPYITAGQICARDPETGVRRHLQPRRRDVGGRDAHPRRSRSDLRPPRDGRHPRPVLRSGR